MCRRPVDGDGPRRPLRLRVANAVGAKLLGPYVHAGRCELAILTLETLRRGFGESTREERSADELADVLLRLWRTGRGPDPADALEIIRARLVELGRRIDEPELVPA